jgi:hypothetical protein
MNSKGLLIFLVWQIGVVFGVAEQAEVESAKLASGNIPCVYDRHISECFGKVPDRNKKKVQACLDKKYKQDCGYYCKDYKMYGYKTEKSCKSGCLKYQKKCQSL